MAQSRIRTRTHHSLPQDQALRGAGVDLQLNGLWRVMGTETEKITNCTLDGSLHHELLRSQTAWKSKLKLPSWENGFRKGNVSIVVEMSCVLVGRIYEKCRKNKSERRLNNSKATVNFSPSLLWCPPVLKAWKKPC